jgi:23S rRNA (guanosine2251-2'-O)-methyltransferase
MQEIFGFHAIEETIRSGGTGRIEYSDVGPRVKKILELAAENGVSAKKVDASSLIKHGPSCRGIVFFAQIDVDNSEVDFDEWVLGLGDEQDVTVLLLDHLSDPHNLGAILRSSDQFGVGLVVLPTNRTVKGSDTVLRTSAGAGLWVKQSYVGNLARAAQKLKDNGFWIYAADMDGTDLWKTKFSGRIALIMGAEGKGVSRIMADSADATIRIPAKGHIDSLNVSVACGVFLYEVMRQRQS